MHVAVAGDSVLVDSASLWLVSDYARDGGRVAVLEPVTHEQARRAIDLVAPTLEPGESIYRVGPAEQLDVDAGRFQSVALPGTVDVAVSRGVNEGGRLMAVETLADSVRVYQRGVIMH